MIDKLVWIDIETTGLDFESKLAGVHKHKVLELAVHITDQNFNILDEGLEIVINHPTKEIEAVISDFVLNMHTENGLLDRVSESTINTNEAASMVCYYLHKHGVEKGVSPLCGNSIKLDKNFIDAQLPAISEWLHYRLIDVSSFKEVYKRLAPDVYKKVEELKGSYSKHRALDDIKFSIAEMCIYRDHMTGLVKGT